MAAAPSSTPSGRMVAKAEEIRRVLSEPAVDLWKLRDLALTEGGLVNDSLRKMAWPKLVGLHNNLISTPFDFSSSLVSARSDDPSNGNGSNSSTPPSLDAEQIERDVSRVTWHLLSGNQRSRNFQMKNRHRKRIAQLLKRKQRRLGDFLNLVLVWSYCDEEGGDCGGSVGEGGSGGKRGESAMQNPSRGGSIITGSPEEDEDSRLRYYQGYHDVASIVLSVLGGASLPVPPAPPAPPPGDVGQSPAPPTLDDLASSTGLDLASRVLLRLSRSHLRDALRSNFVRLQSALRLIVIPLLGAFDAELHSHLVDCDMEPYFCLSWIITWFAHDVRDTALVKRLYDFFIVSHPLMSVYVSVAMMVHPLNRIEVLEADCDFACVHHVLADLPKNSSNVGWKYLPGEHCAGYVTGEDEEEGSHDPSLQDQSLDEEDGSMASGPLGGGGKVGGKARVPFQELIDLSVSMMHKIPPRNLVNLARQYHAEITLKPLMAQTSTIALLQPPPPWGLASHAASDWVLKKKMREEQGLTKLNRHQRKNRLKQQEFSTATTALDKRKLPPPVQAVIASGTGPDGLAEARVLRKKRRMLARSFAIVALSVFVALARDYFSRQTEAAETLARPPRLQQTRQQRATGEDVLVEDGVAPSLLKNQDSDVVASLPVRNDYSHVPKLSVKNHVAKMSVKNDDSDVVVVNKDEKVHDGISSSEIITIRKEEMIHTKRTEKIKLGPAPLKKEESFQPPAQKRKRFGDLCENDDVDTADGSILTNEKSSTPSLPSMLEEEGIVEQQALSYSVREATPNDFSSEISSDVVVVNKDEKVHDDISSSEIITIRKEETIHTKRTEKIKLAPAPLKKEESFQPPAQKRKRFGDLCENDDVDTADGSILTNEKSSTPSLPSMLEEQGIVEQQVLSYSVREATPNDFSSEISPASSEGEEKGKLSSNVPQKEQIYDMLANEEVDAVVAVASSLPPLAEEKAVKQEQSSSSAKEDTQEVMVRNSMVAAKETFKTIQFQLDELEQHFDTLMMRVVDNSKAAWTKIAPVLMKVLRTGWRRVIVTAGWLNSIAAPALKEELALELEGAPPEWANDATEMWKKQRLLLRNRGKFIANLAKVGKESLSKRL